MNSTETTMVLGVLQAAYPAFYKELTIEKLRSVANLWTEMFKDDNFRTVMAATQALIATRTEGFPPTIGEVKEKLSQLRNPDELSEQEAWTMVSKACQNGYYNAVEEFEKLPESVQKAVGGPEQLRAWAQMDSETVESVVASNFMRTFRVTQKRQKEMNMMPTDVRQYMSAIADRMSIGGQDRKQLEKPRQATLLPPKLEKLGLPSLEKVLPKPDAPEPPSYHPPSGELWVKKREEAIAKLMGTKEANVS